MAHEKYLYRAAAISEEEVDLLLVETWQLGLRRVRDRVDNLEGLH